MAKNAFLINVGVFISRNRFMRTILYPVRIVRSFFLKPHQKWQMNIVSNLSDVLVDDVLVRVDEFSGVFSLSGRSSLFHRLIIHKSYEPQIVNIVKRIIDQRRDVIDVGANIGFYAVMFANLIDDNRRVLAIEPTIHALQRLKKNLSLNQVGKKVVVFEGGVVDAPGFLEIKTAVGREEYSTFGLMIHPSASTDEIVTERVQVSTIDMLVDLHSLTPGFIKIDVEGMEPMVFYGMQNTLQVYRPIVLAEWDEFLLKSNGFVLSEVIDWLKAFEYMVLDPLAPSFPPLGNILCCPAEYFSELKARILQ